MDPFQPISRRDILRLGKTFGWTSTILAMISFGGSATLPQLAKAAESINKNRLAKKTRVNLLFGAAIIGNNFEQIDIIGCSQFIRDLEERTDGEIRVELMDQNKICTQLDCVKRSRDGIIDIYSSTTQNASVAVPYFNVLDFPYLFPSRAAQNYFFYHFQSEKLLREPLIKHYGIRFLFTNCRLRGIMLGQKWRDKPNLVNISQLSGIKIRTTATHIGMLALELLNMQTIPIPWEETAGALKYGMVDAIESYESSVAAVIPELLSQMIDIRLFSGNWHTGMNESVFQKLTPELQNAVMESAYQTQVFIQLASESAIINTVGGSSLQKQDTIFKKNGIRFVELPEEELKKAERLCSPEFNPKPWEEYREKLNKLAGNSDVYKEIYSIAREIPSDKLAENVQPYRWWKKR
ncbi:MAG: TRAP transporter substrate-binding protein DctP [Desulfobacterales bacterium]|nr:TRAP transporter substrate-binding protein DctP [Desulfobacterales bacterium]